jgi:quercetin dioxygenase-like cupin family protein
MKKANLLVGAFIAGVLLSLAPGGSVWPQDPVKVAPEVYKVPLENEKVRVLEIHLKKGGKSAMHSHPAFVIVALSPCQARFTMPDGKTKETMMKPGQVVWSEATTHSVENIGSSECHVLNIELKGPAGSK